MSDYVTLLGAEDVRQAGMRIQSAAERMAQAAVNIEAAFTRHEQFLDNWLQQLQAALSKGE